MEAKEQSSPSKAGRLLFSSGVSRVIVRADASVAGLYRARFEGPEPRVGAEDRTVTIRYPRFPLFGWHYYPRERPSEIALNASIPWEIEIRDGASRLTADLRGLCLRSFEMSGGASRVELTLPPPSGTVPVRVLGGASRVAIHRPGGVAACVRVDGGSTNLAFDGRRFGVVVGRVRLQSPDYENAPDRYDFTITGGARTDHRRRWQSRLRSDDGAVRARVRNGPLRGGVSREVRSRLRQGPIPAPVGRHGRPPRSRGFGQRFAGK